MARLLRSYIQDFVQEEDKWRRVPPFGACRGPPRRRGKGEVKPPNSVQHATQGSADFSCTLTEMTANSCLTAKPNKKPTLSGEQ